MRSWLTSIEEIFDSTSGSKTPEPVKIPLEIGEAAWRNLYIFAEAVNDCSNGFEVFTEASLPVNHSPSLHNTRPVFASRQKTPKELMTTKSVSLVRIFEAADKFKECNTIHWFGSSSLNSSNNLFSALLVVLSEITLGIILAIITPILRFLVNLLFIWT